MADHHLCAILCREVEQMAGKRQHYIPRLLQRGFLADPDDEAERTWLHRHGISARLVGIRDIGVTDWFYSRKSLNGQPTLDDTITEYELDLAKSVKSLREAAPGTTVAAHQAAETVVHLVLRAAHLRNLVSSGFSRLIGEVEAIFTDPVRLGNLMGLTRPTLSETARKAIRDTASELVPAGIPLVFAERLLTFMLREFSDQLLTNAATSSAPLIIEGFGDIAARVRDLHNAILARPVADNGWVVQLATLDWTVEGAEDLILPDAIALSRAAGERLSPLLFTSGVDAELVVMPVGLDRILVGRRNGAIFDLAHFNADAAAASESFFIAARPMDDANLRAQIGSGPIKALEQTISKAIAEAEQARLPADYDVKPMQPESRTVQNFSYSVRLADFGDPVLAKEIADVIQAVVAQLAREIPLQDLDGLTIAADYDAALANLDRGDPDLPPVTSRALGYGLGVAKQIAVQREGMRKEHLVVAAGIAETWISPEVDTRAFGLHMLVKMLAGVAHATRYAGCLSVEFKPDPIARELHLAVATAPCGYWCALQAAFVAPNEGATYAELVVTSLEHAEREIAAERAKMTAPSDIGPSTRRALECVTAVLGHAANWLGHRDGLAPGEEFAGSGLPSQLKSRGLDRWIEVFGRDLAACYGPEGTLELAVVTTLSCHVERLFWSLGLYCWPEGNDVRCIVSDQSLLPSRMPINGGLS